MLFFVHKFLCGTMQDVFPPDPFLRKNFEFNIDLCSYILTEENKKMWVTKMQICSFDAYAKIRVLNSL